MTADRIERYLDRLLSELRGSAPEVRRILSEAQEHLRDAAAELTAAGASEEEAQRQVIERFGNPREVARRFSTRLTPIPPVAVAVEVARTAVLLGAVALVAIGASGALAELLGRVFGASSPATCPTSPTCRSAAPSSWSTSRGRAAASRPPRRTTGARWWSTGWRSACWGCCSSACTPCGNAAAALGLLALEAFVVAGGTATASG